MPKPDSSQTMKDAVNSPTNARRLKAVSALSPLWCHGVTRAARTRQGAEDGRPRSASKGRCRLRRRQANNTAVAGNATTLPGDLGLAAGVNFRIRRQPGVAAIKYRLRTRCIRNGGMHPEQLASHQVFKPLGGN